MNHRTRFSGVSLPVMAAILAAPAIAQDASPSDDDTAMEMDRVVVTGEKQNRSLQDTVTSVDVTTSEDIRRLNIVDLEDALLRVGNAGFVTVGSGRNEQFTLRGVQSQGVTGGSNTPVSTLYIDGAVVPNQAAGAAISNAWDVQQIEVLRGAQSTVQGRNSLIGAIVVTTMDPTDEFDWAGRFTYSEEDTLEVSGAVGGPIIPEQLGFRLSGQYTESDGFVTRLDGSNGDAEDTLLFRGKLRFTPTAIPRLQADLTGIYLDETDGLSLVDAADPGARLQVTDVATVTERELYLSSLFLTYDLTESIDLVSLTTYSQLLTDEVSDFDGLPADPSMPITPMRFDDREQEDFQQEFRILFETERFSGLLGALYAERVSDDLTSVTQTFGIPPIDLAPFGLGGIYTSITADATAAFNPPGGFPLNIPDDAPRLLTDPLIFGNSLPVQSDFTFAPEFETWAAFGEISFRATDKLTLTGGFRYEREEADFGASQVNILVEESDAAALTTGNPALPGVIEDILLREYTPILGASDAALAAAAAAAAPDIAATYPAFGQAVVGILAGPNFLVPIAIDETQVFDVFLPKGVITYDFTDAISLSASVQRAYRPGGIGINPVRGEPFIFDEEDSWNYELALRAQSPNGRWTFNANAFFIDWQDQQLEVTLSPTPQDTEVVNAGESQLYGLEATLDVAVNENWDVFATLGLLETEITEDDRPEVIADPSLSLVGNSFPFAPTYTATVGANFEYDFGLSGTVDVNFSDGSEPLLPNGQGFPENDSRVLVNFRLGYEIFDNTDLFVFGSNIFDDTFLANAAAAGGGVVVGDPQVFGIGLQFRR
ncbi:MAG: TonB-dependent receptor [Pseudomonadota bacterium]